VRRLVALGSLVVLVATTVAVVERLSQDRRYRQLLAEGARALDRGHGYAAIEAFSGALALRPSAMVAYYRRGEAYGQQGELEPAVRDLRAARKLAPGASQPLEALGRLYERQGDHAESARWYAQASRTLGDADPTLLYALALARYRAGDPAAAREPLRLAVARDDSMVGAHHLLGLVYRDSQNPAQAVASLQRAIRLAPTLVAAREELADLYHALDRPEDEMAQRAALAAHASDVQRALAIALVDIRGGRLIAADSRLAAADAAFPNDSRIALAFARLHLAQFALTGDANLLRRARTRVETALTGTARRSEGLALYGRVLFLSGDAAAAERLLEEAARTTPLAPEALAFLADASEARGHSGAARDALLGLDALDGDTAAQDVRLARAIRIGTLSLDAGDAATAIRFLTTALASGGTDKATVALLARAHWLSGDRSAARATIAAALERDPDDAALARVASAFR
jgi:tetratricopeptide (TPR) repeat protein